jgi:leader peptidase (prepilin peptidase)/N-methyltransferase
VPLIFIDAEHWVLPFELTLPGIALAVLLRAPEGLDAVQTAALGVAAGFLLFRALEFAGWAATGREALGAGDKYLLAMVLGFLGWRALLGVVLLSSVQASVVGLIRLRLTGKAHEDAGAPAAEAPRVDEDAQRVDVTAPATSDHAAATPPEAPSPDAARDHVSVGDAAVTAPGPASADITPPSTPEAAPVTTPMTAAAPTAAGPAEDEPLPRQRWTPAFLAPGLPLWRRALLVPYALLFQDVPDPELDEDTGEDTWTPQANNLPFGPWIGLAALEMLLLGPWVASKLMDTPFRLQAQLLSG